MNRSLAVCHCSECHHFIILPTQCCAILGSVIFFPLSHLSMPELPDKRMCKKMLYFPQLGWRIYCRMATCSSVLSGSALPKIPAENRGLLPSCAQDLRPCLLVRFLCLAGIQAEEKRMPAALLQRPHTTPHPYTWCAKGLSNFLR